MDLAQPYKAAEAAIINDWTYLLELYEGEISKGVNVTRVFGGTLLHLVVWHKREDFLRRMLEKTPTNNEILQVGTKESGNTILHEAAIVGVKGITEMIVNKKSCLTENRNNLGETPIFVAAANGKTEMVSYLSSFVDEHNRSLLRRNDDSSILHISISNQFFETALKVAKLHPHLIPLQDSNGLTALHLLASLPPMTVIHIPTHHAVRKGIRELRSNAEQKMGFLSSTWRFRRFSCLSVTFGHFVQVKCRNPGSMDQHSILTYLTELLVASGYENDTSQERDLGVPYICNTVNSRSGSPLLVEEGRKVETPLSIAAKKGNAIVVEKIFCKFPCATEYVNDFGQNLLHLVVIHRQESIFNLIKGMDIATQRLASSIDDDGNTVLHHAAQLQTNQNWDKPGAYLPMQWEYLWFKSVEKITPPHLIHHRNKVGDTAKELFIRSHSDLMKQDEALMKSMATSWSVAAALIATIASAALFTIPGGNDQNSGDPLKMNNGFFIMFLVTDVISLGLSLQAMQNLLLVLSWRCRELSFFEVNVEYLVSGMMQLHLSVISLLLSFIATLYVYIGTRRGWASILGNIFLNAALSYAIFYIVVLWKSPFGFLNKRMHYPS